MWRWICRQVRRGGASSARPRSPLRHRRLAFQPCESRLLLSAAPVGDTDWLWQRFREEFAERSPRDVEVARIAESPTTLSQIDGPERIRLDADASQNLDELTRAEATDVKYLWSLRAHDVEDGQLPPTPWCDDEFRSTLDELLLPEAGNHASDWTLDVQGGFVPTSPGGMDGERSWEASTVIQFGLNLDGPARFQADLVQLLYPEDAADDAFTEGFEGDFPVFYSTISVSMEWSSLGRFWDYPLAEDLIDLVVGPSSLVASWNAVSPPSHGNIDRALPTSYVAYDEASDPLFALADFTPDSTLISDTTSIAPTSLVQIDSLFDRQLATMTKSWSDVPGPHKAHNPIDPMVRPISGPHWNREDDVVEFGPRELDFLPPQFGDFPDAETPDAETQSVLGADGDLRSLTEDVWTARDEDDLYAIGDSPFVEDVTHAGFQRLQASDLGADTRVTGVVDLGTLAGTDMIVLSAGEARSVVAQASLSESAEEEAFGDGNRTRVQEFVLVAAAIGPDSATSSDVVGSSADGDRPTHVNPSLPPAPPSTEVRPPTQDDPISGAGPSLSTVHGTLPDLDDHDICLAQLHDAALISLGYLVRAPHECVSAILPCLLSQIILLRESDSEEDRSRLRRGPRLRA